MELYNFLPPWQMKIVKEKTDIRNVKITDLTFIEILEISKVLNKEPETLFREIWSAI